jgi:hypothetical protein
MNHTKLFLLDEDDEDDKDRAMSEFDGVAWYKIYFKVPPSVIKKVNYISYEQLGASQIFIDGTEVKSFGKIDNKGNTIEGTNVTSAVIPFVINDTLTHVLAIRYSLSNYEQLNRKHNYNAIGPLVRLSNGEIFEDEQRVIDIGYNAGNMLAAFFFALFVIHLLIYFFYREKNFNLYYSLFLLFLSLCFFEVYFVRFIDDIDTYMFVSRIDSLFFPACCFFLVTLLNKLLNTKRTWHYIGFVILFLALICDTLFTFGIGGSITISIVFYTYFNTLAHSIVGIRRKVPSSKFLGWGILSFTIFVLVGIAMVILLAVLGDSKINRTSVILLFVSDIILAILSIPLSMSAYLAYDFARTNKSLKEQLAANEELSRKTIEQEKEKQEILANQNKVLEMQVEERTREINEQKNLIEEKQTEILDSIRYAKRIQNSLMPTEKFILRTIARLKPNGK